LHRLQPILATIVVLMANRSNECVQWVARNAQTRDKPGTGGAGLLRRHLCQPSRTSGVRRTSHLTEWHAVPTDNCVHAAQHTARTLQGRPYSVFPQCEPDSETHQESHMQVRPRLSFQTSIKPVARMQNPFKRQPASGTESRWLYGAHNQLLQ